MKFFQNVKHNQKSSVYWKCRNGRGIFVKIAYLISKKTVAELKKQIADLIDIKKKHQVQQTEFADKLSTENKGTTFF